MTERSHFFIAEFETFQYLDDSYGKAGYSIRDDGGSRAMKLYQNGFDQELFRHPPAVYHGAPFWAWNTRLDQAQLMQQPRIEYAFVDQEPLPLLTRQVRGPAERPWKGVSNAAGLRLLFEQALTHRKPHAILIDEAEHIAKAARGSKLLDLLDHLKAWRS
jgi:hypothetical protein